MRARMWGYVHDEMSDRERESFEAELRADPRLQEEAASIRAVDMKLSRLLPYAELSTEEISDRILRALERDVGLGEPAAVPRRTTVVAFPRWREYVTSGVFSRWSFGVAAAAAALLIVGAIPHLTVGPVTWDRPEFVTTTYRGGDPDAQPAYTPRDAAACLSSLKESIRRAQGGRDTGLCAILRRDKPDWTLGFSFRQAPEGAICVRVGARNTSTGESFSWQRRADGLDNFLLEADDFAGEIADALTGFDRKRDAG